MPAHNHINKTQKMYHMSWNAEPPHEKRLDKPKHALRENEHPNVIHMGTRRAALNQFRTYLHEYEMDTSHADPVVYSDESSMVERTESTRNPHDSIANSWRKAMSGKQEGLWETVQPDIKQAASKGTVIPYRNRAEDAGSISYAVPKAAVKSGKVRYVGVTNMEEPGVRSRMEKEEGY